MNTPARRFDAKLTDEFRRRLLEAREMLLRTVATSDEELAGLGTGLEVGDPTDRATAASIASMGSRLTGQDKRELDEIAEAMHRLGSGAYGMCESCRAPIALSRLRAVPAARFCVPCQETQEEVAP
jgi:DnaK suppressor protein